MNRYLQEFFWMPEELLNWLQARCRQVELWIVLWKVGADAQLVGSDDLQLETFHGTDSDVVQIFIGAPDVSRDPVWRLVNGRRLLNFQSSYVVQLVPSVITPDERILLQGRLAILRPNQYADAARAKKLLLLCRRLRSSMKSNSDVGQCIVQRLSNGQLKHPRGSSSQSVAKAA